MKEILNAYSVYILNEVREFGEYDFEKSYMNGEDNIDCDNKAVKGAIEYLESLNSDQMIGLMVFRQEMIKSVYSNTYIGGRLHDIYSHIHNDKSNWVSVAEALNFLKKI